MVDINNHLGSISISKRFLTALIGGTVTNCYGVVGTNAGNIWQNALEAVQFVPFLHGIRKTEKGVNVKTADGKIYIGLHITVLYGVNVSSVVKSIQHKVAYAVEENTGMRVGRVNVFVDAIQS